MRLISYKASGVAQWGLLDNAAVIPARLLDDSLPDSLLAFIAATDDAQARLSELQARATGAEALALSEVELLPCVPQPGKMICLGVNYVDHAKEGGNQIGDYPALFLRCATSLAGAWRTAAGAAGLRASSTSKPNWRWSSAGAHASSPRPMRSSRVRLRLLQRRHAARLPAQDDPVDDRQELRCDRRLRPLPGHAPTSCRAGCVGLRIESRLNGEVMQNAEHRRHGVRRGADDRAAVRSR